MAGESSPPEFVEWREQYVNQERGSRLVHYYLDDSAGGSYLAVVGTERSLRHMLYVADEDFCRAHGPGKSGAAALPLKWRARREVVDWLASFIPGRASSRSYFKMPLALPLATGMTYNGLSDAGSYKHHQMEFCRSLSGQDSDIEWSGVSWTCGKQLSHYQAFCRDGIAICAHSFVLVMSEEENRYLAYLEDMYEDKKGQKKVKVRWFHQNQEFACSIPPPSPHPCEVFITPYSQVISAECVDDIASVLTPDHYEKCLATLPCSSPVAIWFCFRQYSKNKFKLFDVRTLRGYFNQAVLACLDITIVSGDEDGFDQGSTIKRGGSKRIRFVKGAHKSFLSDCLGVKTSGYSKHIKSCKSGYQNITYDLTMRRPLSVKFIGPRSSVAPAFDLNQKIELLCHDSGIRGCWFKCTVLQLSSKRLKVRYDDVQDDDDCGNLEEWVPAFRTAAPDKLGMRCSGRLNIRPAPSSNCLPENVALEVGTPVDAWWSDGWWEGVVIGTEGCGDDSTQVYFPGEDIFLLCQRKSLRISKDWVGNRWLEIKAKPDILSSISLVDSQAKLTSCSVLAKGAESGSSAMSDRGAMATQADSNDEDMKMDDSFNRSNTAELLENTRQCIDMSIVAKEMESEITMKLDSGEISVQINSNNEDNQTDEDKSGCGENPPPETIEQLNSRKRHRDEDDEEDRDAKVIADIDNS